MSIRPLSRELALIAEKELNEVPSRIPEDLKHLKEWIAKQPHLRARTDDQWLMAFLRGCKHSLERAKEKLDLFYTMKTLLPEFFANRDPFLPEFQQVFQKAMAMVLPATINGSRVYIWRTQDLDPETFTPAVAVQVILAVVDTILVADDNAAVAGTHLILDCENVPYKFVFSIPPIMLKQLMMLVQKAYPLRIRGARFINIPSFAEPVAALLKSFATTKMRSRLHFYTKDKISDLHKFIPLPVLPTEYGGAGGSVHEMAAKLKALVDSRRDWLNEDVYFGTDETKRLGKPVTYDDMFGMEGSFRKLNID